MQRKLTIAALSALAVYLLWPKKAKAEARPTAPLPQPTVEVPELPPVTVRETAGPSEPIASGLAYSVKPGESWSNIAERTYGNYRWWPFLWDTNRSKFPNPDKLAPGSSISIPPKSTLPLALQSAYFDRAEQHKKVWAAHRRSSNWGKSLPKLPASVTTPTR